MYNVHNEPLLSLFLLRQLCTASSGSIQCLASANYIFPKDNQLGLIVYVCVRARASLSIERLCVRIFLAISNELLILILKAFARFVPSFSILIYFRAKICWRKVRLTHISLSHLRLSKNCHRRSYKTARSSLIYVYISIHLFIFTPIYIHRRTEGKVCADEL